MSAEQPDIVERLERAERELERVNTEETTYRARAIVINTVRHILRQAAARLREAAPPEPEPQERIICPSCSTPLAARWLTQDDFPTTEEPTPIGEES